MSSIDKFRNNPTQNLGEGYYPFGNNYNNFKAFQHPPSQPVENDFTETKGDGNPILILHEPLPTQYTSVEEIRPQMLLNSDEVALRKFNVEQEQMEEDSERRKELQMDLQGQINMKSRMEDDYKGVIERTIYDISSSSMPTADKILRIHELMREADNMGLSPSQAQPLLLETMNKYGLSVGFEGVIEELRRRQQPLEPQAVGVRDEPSDFLREGDEEDDFGGRRELLRNREGRGVGVEEYFGGFYEGGRGSGGIPQGAPIMEGGVAPMGMGISGQMPQPALPSGYNPASVLPSRPVDSRFAETGRMSNREMGQRTRRRREGREEDDRRIAEMFRGGGAVSSDEMRRFLERKLEPIEEEEEGF